MKAGVTACPPVVLLTRTRLADYAELTKPRVGLLVLFTVAAGACLASPTAAQPAIILNVVCGTALVVAGASVLNQVLERRTDALMARTEARPLPAGRLPVAEAATLGASLAATGLAYLAVSGPHVLAAAVAALALVIYVFVYTPLKRRTTLNTLVGAVPGALPPVIGWTAVRGSLSLEAVILFAILFLWQVPHFLAIAWVYRSDYARAGLQMLPTLDRGGLLTGRQMVNYCLALVAVSLAPAVGGLAGPFYALGALALGLGFLWSAWAFSRRVCAERARRVLWASLVYLPGVFGLLLVDSLLAWGGPPTVP